MIDNLIAEMCSVGLIIDNVVSDGHFHKTEVIGKKGKRGWYISKEINNKIYCTYGRFDPWQKIRWNNNGSSVLSDFDHAELDRINQQIEKERIEKQQKAAEVANRMWEKASDSGIENHEYLIKKGIKPHNIRVFNDMLLVPIYDEFFQLVNLQRIFPDGKKKFLFGGRITGCAGKICGTERICICEGYATAASIFEATGFTVIIAFNAGNLKPAAEMIRSQKINADILICGDNDESGVGQTKAEEAAKSILSGFIIPPIVGYDFNDLMQHSGNEAVKNTILNINSCGIYCLDNIRQDDSINLIIPEELYKIPGLISDGLEACKIGGSPDIIQYNLPVVLSVIARSVASKLCIHDVWPSMYNVKIGGTSTGKTDSDKFFQHLIKLDRFYGPTDFSSGPGLLRSMTESPQMMIALDEISFLFKRTKDDLNGNGKISTLLELYTKSGIGISRPYADKAIKIVVENPCLVLTGNATQDIFDNIRMEDMTSGAMQRFDFWMYDGEIPYRNISKMDNPAAERFLEGISRIYTSYAPKLNKYDMRYLSNYPLDFKPDALEFLESYSKEIITEANKYKGDNGKQGIISRRYNLALKYAIVHIAATREAENIYNPVEIIDLKYGIAMAKLLADWKINVLMGKITAGEFHKDCEIFKEAIIASMKSNKRPTLKMLCDRKKDLCRLKPKEIQDIINTLTDRGEIIIDNSAIKPAYWLKKDEEE